MSARVTTPFLNALWSYKFLLVAFYIGFVFAKKVHRYLTSPFRKQGIPGPFLAKFTNLYRFYGVIRRTWHRDLVEIHEKYGTIVWIAPNELSISDPKLRGTIYGFANAKKDETYFLKAPAFESGQINDDFNFVFEQNPERARLGKYNMGHYYSEQGLAQLEDNFDNAIKEFGEGLKKYHIDTGTNCDLSEWSHMYYLDLVAQLTCNHSAGFCLSGEDKNGTAKGMRFIFDLIGSIIPIPLALTISSRGMRKLLVKTRLQRLYRNTMCLAKGVSEDEGISEISEKEPNHLLSKFYKAQSAMKKRFPMGNSNEGTTNHILNLAAGAVGAAPNVLCAVTTKLLEHPEVMAKLREEIDSLETSTIPISAFLRSNGSTNSLPYLEAVILETIRITPVVGISLSRLVPSVGCYLNDYYVPPGFIVGMSAWPVNFNKSYFGEDVAEFKPERWLRNHPTELAADGSGKPRTMRAYIEAGWMAFGAGARVCLGRHLALFSLMKTVGKMFRDYDIELIQKPKERFGLFISETDMKVVFKNRGEGYTGKKLPGKH
ncbi:hypothetical protein RUND412_001871 [Rhizina undulata]